ncbi:MAG TPA: F0F1 ATP synthase subunit gamma [Candidatus Saccharimonadales bacterium]|nr:F0F1 ATP synthase subunit gamma [Candidatus Saccharimonadales bacterium]
MRRSLAVQQDMQQTDTVESLTEVFEGIASIHISKIRNRVVASKSFFAELWTTYQGLRVDPRDRLARTRAIQKDRDVIVAVTGEGSRLSGSTDEKILEQVLTAYQGTHKTDLVTIGSHGFSYLNRRGIRVAHAFSLPISDFNFSVNDMIKVLNEYRRITVFYQTYESLRSQKIASISLTSAVRSLGEDVTNATDVVSSHDYIFEPNITEIADYMESVMMGVALIQIIMEAKLAQYASRFNAMSNAKQQAKDLFGEYRREFNHAKRAESDERIKEVMKVVHHGHSRTD